MTPHAGGNPYRSRRAGLPIDYWRMSCTTCLHVSGHMYDIATGRLTTTTTVDARYP